MRRGMKKNSAGSCSQNEMTDYYAAARALFPYSQKLRRDFHRNPELGFQEVRTAGIIQSELNHLNMELTAGVAKTGIVAVMEAKQPGAVVMMRFDMDALPIQEETGKEYASTRPGVMHACGHDGHVSIGLTVAQLLHQHRDQLSGSAKFVFQPAEEGLGGAEEMISAGALVDPMPQYTLSLHIWNEEPIGTIVISPGALMAGADIFHVKITGRGGHGALPHQTVDPVVAAAHIVVALQTIVSRTISPLQSAVVSVTQVTAGDAFNVIPQRAELRGTIRTFDATVRETVLKRFKEIVESIAAGMGCRAEVILTRVTPPVVNDAILAGRLAERVSHEMPTARLLTNYQSMVSEDMAFFMERVPGVYMLVGGANPEKNLDFPHHHPRFDFDEEALVWASALMAIAASEVLKL